MAEPDMTSLSALRRFAQQAQQTVEQAGEPAEERCELCSQPIAPRHRHLLEVASRELLCVCLPCSILFDRRQASLGQYRLIPQRRLYLEDFRLADHLWASLRIPVDVAYFVENSSEGHVVAYYPSPLGPTESALRLSAWQQIVDDNPQLEDMAPDVEALLVDRTRGARDHYLAPITDCYRLAAILRTHWRGINGGDEVWDKIEEFFRHEFQQNKAPNSTN